MSKGGRYVHRPGHPKANDMGMVNVLDLSEEDGPREEGRNDLTIMAGRFYENTKSPIDGSDIGSRSKRREHMKEYGLVDAGDYKGEWEKARKAREDFRRTGDDGKPWAQRFAESWEQIQKRGKY
jgi:hypothetical protein